MRPWSTWQLSKGIAQKARSRVKLIIPVPLTYLGSEHEGDGGEVAVADGQQAEEGDVVTLVQEDDLKM